jgi:hypothetical protein
MRVVAVIDAPDFSSEGRPEPTAAAKALNESAKAAPTPTEAPKLVALATELEDLGIVEAKKAKAIVQEHTDGSGEAVILRDPNVAAMPASKGTFKAEAPKKAQAERNKLAASLKVGATAPLGHKESKPKPASKRGA